MHRGVREFIQWIEKNRDRSDIKLNPPATAAELSALEQQLGGPLPADLRFVLGRFNGGDLPTGSLLPGGIEPGTIGAAVRKYAEAVGADFLDPELLLPFFRTAEDSLLCFDRSAGPVSDTWPIVDYDSESGEERLVYRTFDGFCRNCVADWTAPDFHAEFTLDTYLNKGRRHAAIEHDVASAHATVAHASKRAGLADEALESYLKAARCVPPLPWCDWEALKIAVLIGSNEAAFEAASRLCSRAPAARWQARETTPGRVAEVIGAAAARADDTTRWVRLLDQLAAQTDDASERAVVDAVRAAAKAGAPMPDPRPVRSGSVVAAEPDAETFWQAARKAYLEGRLRDEDLLFDPAMLRLAEVKPIGDLLRIRRDF